MLSPTTRVDEIAPSIYRIHTPIDIPAGAFSFNQYLIADDEPLLFHTGPRKQFPLVRGALERVLPASGLRHIAFSHFEADECGALNEWLAVAPRARPVCGTIAAMVSVDDVADRPARALADGEELWLGERTVRWLDTPHLPHGWECGYLWETSTRTLLCGDLFTQPGAGDEPLTTRDVLELSEDFRAQMEYYALGPDTGRLIEKLAALAPTTLACMHGSAWSGDGAALLRELGRRLQPARARTAPSTSV